MNRSSYADRADAGDVLSQHLSKFTDRDDVLVLALPRGGVPVAARVADALHASLDVIIVGKIGHPRHHELAIGAIASTGGDVEIVRNDVVLSRGDVSEQVFTQTCVREMEEIRRRTAAYRGQRAVTSVADRCVILVDDGVATGSTMRAAIAAVLRQQPRRLVVAVPIGAAQTCAELAEEVDEVICPWTPEPFWAVGPGYLDFTQVDDAQVRLLLGRG
jgi:putative phosphoribosyl transferase